MNRTPKKAGYNAIVLREKKQPLAVHAIFSSMQSAEKHLRDVIPDYCARGLFINKTLQPSDFEIHDGRMPSQP